MQTIKSEFKLMHHIRMLASLIITLPLTGIMIAILLSEMLSFYISFIIVALLFLLKIMLYSYQQILIKENTLHLVLMGIYKVKIPFSEIKEASEVRYSSIYRTYSSLGLSLKFRNGGKTFIDSSAYHNYNELKKTIYEGIQQNRALAK